MATVTVPRMLAELIGGDRSIDAAGATVGDALENLCSTHPGLRVHLFDEDGGLREHVRCFHNDRSTDLDREIRPGDSITILQAVSGG